MNIYHQPSETFRYLKDLLNEFGTDVNPDMGPVLDPLGSEPRYETTRLAGFEIDFNGGGRGRLVVRGVQQAMPDHIRLCDDPIEGPMRRRLFNEKRQSGVLADAAWDIRNLRGIDVGRACLLEAYGPGRPACPNAPRSIARSSEWSRLIVGRHSVTATLRQMRLPSAEVATSHVMDKEYQLTANPITEPSRFRMLVRGALTM